MRRIALAVMTAVLAAGCSGKGDSLLVYCGGTMRPPMEEIAKLYQQKYGLRVDLSFGDSGVIVIQAYQRKEGDAIVLHDPFGQMIAAKGLAAESVRAAVLTPVVAVQPGTKGDTEVSDLADLAKPDLKVAIPHTTKSTCGQVLAEMLAKSGLWDSVMKNVTFTSRASGDIVNALSVGSVDAAVAWDAVVRHEAKLKLIPIAAKYRVDAVTSATGTTYPASPIYVTISVLKSTKKPDAAAKLLELAASPEGQAVFKRLGFTPVSDAATGTTP